MTLVGSIHTTVTVTLGPLLHRCMPIVSSAGPSRPPKLRNRRSLASHSVPIWREKERNKEMKRGGENRNMGNQTQVLRSCTRGLPWDTFALLRDGMGKTGPGAR
ncbi:hypothetical protein EYF80_054276 [Liparis tanakae]|uniref:Uncharacterized protein n=1 Tax=Liparis tanakae TaxID=230148 RepID=A0A4Z2F3T5_9TELE|nr:hypothetical protein EYF80_054276 [Liparis tanakae]